MKISKKSARSGLSPIMFLALAGLMCARLCFAFILVYLVFMALFVIARVVSFVCCAENIQNLLYCDLTADISRDKNRKHRFASMQEKKTTKNFHVHFGI